MAFAQGSRSSLAFIPEVTFGTTPATPTLTNLPFNSHTLGLTKQTLESGEIRSDRMISVMRLGNRQAGGDIVAELRAGDFDKLLESAFFGAVTAGVLKCGTTQKFISIEDRQSDITKYRLFTGCMVDKLKMSIQPNAMIATTFSILGKDMTQSGTSVTSNAITAASGNSPFDSYTGTLSEGGSTIATVTSLDFDIDNSMTPTFVVGSAVTPFLQYGRSKVTGTIQVYYDDITLMNKFINETESSLQIALTDAGAAHTYTFLFPRIKYTGAAVPVANEQSRIINMPFMALYDAGTGTELQLTIS